MSGSVWSHTNEVSQGPQYVALHFRVTKMPPCDLLAITAWEQRYSTQLPEVRTKVTTGLKELFSFVLNWISSGS